MDFFFTEALDENTMMDTSDSGYSNDDIGKSYMQHFIDNTESSPNCPKKLLLYDGHGSHCIEAFKALVAENNVILFMFPSVTALENGGCTMVALL
jgi:DDE superfamily endonuclease